MSEMLTDLLQNIYGRISQLAKSIQGLQHSIEEMNKTLVDQVNTLVGSIKLMTDSVEKEGAAQQLLLSQIGEDMTSEIKMLQEKVGLKDLNELSDQLRQIVALSEEALRPETVDVLLHEVLTAIKTLKESSIECADDKSSETLLEEIDTSLKKK